MSTDAKRVAAVSAALAHGAPAEDVLSQLEELGVPTVDATRIVATASGALRRSAATKNRIDKKAAWFLEVSRLLQKEQELKLKELSGVSASTFRDDFYCESRPALFRGVAESWPATRSWSPSYFAEQLGDTMVNVMLDRSRLGEHELDPQRFMKAMPLRQYVEAVIVAGVSNDLYMVGHNDNLNKSLANLQSDLHPLPEFLDPARLSGRCSLWFGPAGTVTGLHHDPVNNFLVQIFGEKTVTLYAPCQTRFLYPSESAHCNIDIEQPASDLHPHFVRAKGVSIILGPGDGLFIPVGWWHHVKSHSISASVSMTNFIWKNAFPLDTF